MAKSKGTPVKPKEIERMVELYEQYGTYAKVARIMRRDAATVSKYINTRKAIEEVGYYYSSIIKD